MIIETDEIQWIFEVRGTHLDYKPPEIKKTDIYKMTKTTMQHFNSLNKSQLNKTDSFRGNKRTLSMNEPLQTLHNKCKKYLT